MNNLTLQVKKTFLSVGVIVTFFAYSFALRHQDSTPVILPPSLKNNSSSTPAQATGNSPRNTNSTASHYKDGSYTGSVANAFYGNVQVEAVISGGKLTDVQFLQYPNDNPNSQSINSQATPYLKQEAIQAQTGQVNIITGATLTSQAFIESLSSALTQARA